MALNWLKTNKQAVPDNMKTVFEPTLLSTIPVDQAKECFNQFRNYIESTTIGLPEGFITVSQAFNKALASIAVKYSDAQSKSNEIAKKIKELDQKILDSRAIQDALQKEVSKVNSTAAELGLKVKVTEDPLAAAEQRLKNLRKTEPVITRLELEIEDTLSAIESAKENESKERDELKGIEEKISALQKESEETKAKYDTRIEDVSAKVKELVKKAKEATAQFNQLEPAKASPSAELRPGATYVIEEKTIFDDSEKKTLRELISTVKGDNNALRDEVKSKKKDVELLSLENQNLRDMLDEFATI